MALTLKVDMGGDIRRFRIELPEGSDIASKWQLILMQIRRGYHLPDDAEVTFKYQDDEGDLCTLIQETLPDCLSQAGDGPLKLIARIPATELDPASLLEAIGQLAKDPEKMLEVVDLMQQDPAKLFGVMKAFNAAKWGVMKKAWRGQEEAAAGPGPQAEGAPEDPWAWKFQACPAWKGKGKGKGKWKGSGGWKRREAARKREAGKCPGGHELTLQALSHGSCDACDCQLAEDDTAVGCRECNWDLCWECAQCGERTAAGPPDATSATAQESDAAKTTSSGDEWDLCTCPRPEEESTSGPPVEAKEAKEETAGEAAASVSDDVAGTQSAGLGPQAEWAPKDHWPSMVKGFAKALKGKGKGKWGKGNACGRGDGAPRTPPQPAQPAFGGGQQAQGLDLSAVWQLLGAASQAHMAQQQIACAQADEQWTPVAQQLEQMRIRMQQLAAAQPPAAPADAAGNAGAAP